MKIIVGGAGRVGASIIGYLTQGNNDIVVIDTNPRNLDKISDSWDVRPILGSISHPSVLESADAKNADLLLAVTDIDEVNIVACQIAHSLFEIPQKIARLDSEDYLAPEWADLFSDKSAPIDWVISPDIAIADAVYRLIKLPGATDFLPLLDDKLNLVAFRCQNKCPLIKTPISQLTLLAPELDVSFVTVVRKGEAFVPKDEDILDVGDDVYFLVEKSKLYDAVHAFDMDRSVVEKVLIFGGNQIAFYLARKLEKDDNILSCRIIEKDAHQAKKLAKALNNISVINGDFMNDVILTEAGIQTADIAISMTASDNDNVLSAMLAQKMGASSSISLSNSRSYNNLFEIPNNVFVDRASVIISHILKEIRKAKILKAYSLGQGYGEVWEVVIEENSKIMGKKILNLKLPKNCKICAISRNDNIIFPCSQDVINLGDTIIIYVASDAIKKIEKSLT